MSDPVGSLPALAGWAGWARYCGLWVENFLFDVAPASGGGRARFLIGGRVALAQHRYVCIRSFPPPTSLMQASMNVDWWLARLGSVSDRANVDDQGSGGT